MRRSLVESNSLKFNHLRQFSPDSDTCSDERNQVFQDEGFLDRSAEALATLDHRHLWRSGHGGLIEVSVLPVNRPATMECQGEKPTCGEQPVNINVSMCAEPRC
jgi:hypothetical protein